MRTMSGIKLVRMAFRPPSGVPVFGDIAAANLDFLVCFFPGELLDFGLISKRDFD